MQYCCHNLFCGTLLTVAAKIICLPSFTAQQYSARSHFSFINGFCFPYTHIFHLSSIFPRSGSTCQVHSRRARKLQSLDPHVSTLQIRVSVTSSANNYRELQLSLGESKPVKLTYICVGTLLGHLSLFKDESWSSLITQA